MEMVIARGTHEMIGYELGTNLAEAIRHNILLQDQEVLARGINKSLVTQIVNRFEETAASTSMKLMKGLSRGSGIPYKSILRYNAMQGIISPEECTTFAAIGEATPDGKPVLLKNRDKSGNFDFCGKGYYKNKEVNVVQVLEIDDGNTIVGVTSAGSTGIMMGLNRHGVALASNFGAIKEVSNKSSKELYGISGRPQIVREGLECKSAHEAVNLAIKKLTESPMGSPGMLFFIDAKEIYVIEGTHLSNQFAVQHITDGAISRSNHFELLEHLNNQKYISAMCRKIRARELVEQNYGKIDSNKLKEFSMDHENGPYENSICRHSKNPEGSVTVSAAIIEIDCRNPQKSKISVCLGSPCRAWRNENGSFTFRMDSDIESIPQRFLSEDAFKEFYTPEPDL